MTVQSASVRQLLSTTTGDAAGDVGAVSATGGAVAAGTLQALVNSDSVNNDSVNNRNVRNMAASGSGHVAMVDLVRCR
ncbi:hypothetical protein D3C71_2090160 [compost metagenome]